jgi:hypothetical protein
MLQAGTCQVDTFRVAIHLHQDILGQVIIILEHPTTDLITLDIITQDISVNTLKLELMSTRTKVKTSVRTSTKVAIGVAVASGAAFAAAAAGGVFQFAPGLTIEAQRTGRIHAVSGANDVAMLEMNFTARRQDLEINELTFEFVGDDDGSLPVDFDISGQDVISSCVLKDITTGVVIAGPDAISSANELYFHDAFTINSGDTLNAKIECDFSNMPPQSGNPDLLSFRLVEHADVSVIDLSTGSAMQVRSTKLGKTNRGINRFGKAAHVEKLLHGVVDLEVLSHTPESSIVLGNSSQVHVATFKVGAAHEDFIIDRLTVDNCITTSDTDGDCADTGEVPGEDAAITSLTIEYQDSSGSVITASGILFSGSHTFNGLDIFVSRGGASEFKLYVDISSGVGSWGPDSGDEFQFNIDSVGGDFRALGEDSGQIVDMASKGYATSNKMVVRKTKPTLGIHASTPSGPGSIPSQHEVLRFTVSADSRDDVEMNQIMFNINSSDNDSTGWNTCSNLAEPAKYEIYDASDMSTPLDVDTDWSFNIDQGNCNNSSDQIKNVVLTLSSPDSIGAGETDVFIFSVDSTGASSTGDDFLQVSIPNEANALNWSDYEDTSINALYIEALPVTGGRLIY